VVATREDTPIPGTKKKKTILVRMKSISDPLVLLQGAFPRWMVVIPTAVSQSYLNISRMLKKNMTLTQFRASSKLDLKTNI
jgi:hypothetical protein